MKNLYLYIHVPFCRQKCVYCDFYSVCSENLIPAFCEAVCRSLEFQGEIWAPGRKIRSIYFGGGTPNLLNPHQLSGILEAVHKNFKLAKSAECTIEINPEFSKSRKALQALRDIGFNRLSVGVQSLNKCELKMLGRLHNARTAERCLRHARKIFDNISADLIYAIPGQSLKDLKNNADSLLRFAPEHISAYNLSCEEGTPLAKAVAEEKIRLAGEEMERKHFLFLHDYLTKKGYEHYEISNYARPGHYSLHNSAYWSHRQYLGIGPSAHSLLDGIRYLYPADLKAYLEKPGPFHKAEAFMESEAIITGLRTSKGLDLKFTEPATNEKILKYADAHPEWLTIEEQRVFCTLEGWLMLDSILLDLI